MFNKNILEGNFSWIRNYFQIGKAERYKAITELGKNKIKRLNSLISHLWSGVGLSEINISCSSPHKLLENIHSRKMMEINLSLFCL